ncbi:MAG: NADPH:quinone oxidoreductase family protein [Actinobacteria bacterium]|nr:NADPH:quinone oxidoreductase family protein [Actinomycetota bacterium]
MKALQITELNGPTALEICDIPEPVAGPDEIMIEVHRTGIAFPDLLMTRGLYQVKPELPFVPGTEVGGIVVSAPAGSWAVPGTRVAAYVHTGGCQELVATDPNRVFPLPDRLSFAEGSATPINYLTAHFALTLRGRLAPGETVLVHGAAGGLGVALVQIASALGARVIAVASDETKRQLALAAGADVALPVEDFLPAVKDLTGGQGVDIVADPVGGDRVTDSLRSLRPLGRLLVLGFTGGEIPSIKVNRLLLNNIEAVGVGWGAYALPRPTYPREQWDDLMLLLEGAGVTPVVTDEVPLEAVSAALVAMESRTLVGKTVAIIRD